MEKLIGNKKLFVVFATLLILGYLFFVYFIFSNQNKQEVNDSTPLTKDYSGLNKISPGKSTPEDVKKINGKPTRTSQQKDDTYYYYSTPFKGLENEVLFKNGVVVYALEHVFSNYRGAYDEYASANGQPDFTLYNINGGYPWSVFLSKGLMISSSNNFITAIVYFVPQNKDDFFKNIGRYLDFSEENLNQETDAEFFGPPQ